MKRLFILFLLVIALAVPSDARADVAPPAQPPGSSLVPGAESTQVRMLAETVLIDVRPGAYSKSLGQAYVTASFTMRNLGGAPEQMAARFPISSDDGWGRVNEIRDLKIKVAGRVVETRRIMGENPYYNSEPVPWVEFDVTFPAGEDTPIEVTYTLEASGEHPFIWFKYILSTGAGWKDSIGSADIIVRLPYDVTTQNVLLDADQVWFGTTKGGVMDGNTIHWHYADLEPTTENNFEVNLVEPAAWERLLAEQENVARVPRDGEAWGRLGRLCKQMAFSSRGKGFRGGNMDPGAVELYQRSLDAYEKAITFLPNDALWHAGYADLLGYHAYFEGMSGTNTDEEVAHSLREIQLAVDLAPNDPQVQQISEQLSGFFPGGQTPNDWHLSLTATAAVNPPSPEPLSAIQDSTATQPVTSLASPSSATATTTPPSSRSGSPICGFALSLPLMIILMAFRRVKSDPS